MIQSEFPHAGLKHGLMLHPKRVRDSLARSSGKPTPDSLPCLFLRRNLVAVCNVHSSSSSSFTLGKVQDFFVTQMFVLDMGANVGVERRPRSIKPMGPPPSLQGRSVEGSHSSLKLSHSFPRCCAPNPSPWLRCFILLVSLSHSSPYRPMYAPLSSWSKFGRGSSLVQSPASAPGIHHSWICGVPKLSCGVPTVSCIL